VRGGIERKMGFLNREYSSSCVEKLNEL